MRHPSAPTPTLTGATRSKEQSESDTLNLTGDKCAGVLGPRRGVAPLRQLHTGEKFRRRRPPLDLKTPRSGSWVSGDHLRPVESRAHAMEAQPRLRQAKPRQLPMLSIALSLTMTTTTTHPSGLAFFWMDKVVLAVRLNTQLGNRIRERELGSSRRETRVLLQPCRRTREDPMRWPHQAVKVCGKCGWPSGPRESATWVSGSAHAWRGNVGLSWGKRIWAGQRALGPWVINLLFFFSYSFLFSNPIKILNPN
jgi:hypothetical protein